MDTTLNTGVSRWNAAQKEHSVAELIEARNELADRIYRLLNDFGWKYGVSVRSVDYKVDPDRLFKCDVGRVDVELDI